MQIKGFIKSQERLIIAKTQIYLGEIPDFPDTGKISQACTEEEHVLYLERELNEYWTSHLKL